MRGDVMGAMAGVGPVGQGAIAQVAERKENSYKG